MEEIAVVGAGVMGLDVASTLAHYGYRVIVKDIDSEVISKAPDRIKQNITQFKFISPRLKDWNVSEILSRITFTLTYAGFENVSWVIENVPENLEVKKAVYKELKDVCSTETLYAVNTSCLPITKVASWLPKPDRVIGMHFMNPVPIKDVVETIRGFHMSEETISLSEQLLTSVRKKAILVQDSPGFVSNRLSHLLMNEAAFLVHENVAEPHQIDALFKRGFSHQMGPLETADLIGLDTVADSLDVLFENYQDPKFRVCPLIRKMVDAGLLGRKSGRGFYEYE